MLERHHEPLLPRRAFYRQVARYAFFAALVLIVCLAFGMWGYHHFEHLPWVDSFANAAMILSGMGPLGDLKTTGGKVFAGCYALFSGVVFLTTIGIFSAPIIYRFFHIFHLNIESPKSKTK